MPAIDVKLYAMLRDRLPPGSRGVSGRIDLPDGATIATALDRLDIPAEYRQLVVLNDEEVAAAEWGGRTLRDGDRLAVFPPIAGGR